MREHVCYVLALIVFVSTAHAQSPDLELASVHAVVAELESGNMVYAKHEDKPTPIASITKLMTAMVVLDGGQPLDAWVPILERDRKAAKNAYSRLRVGSEAKRGDLLRIMLMSSENLAAHVLARHYPGGFDAFIAAMNDKAQSLGMTHTRFVDSSGLSPNNQSTAADLAKMVLAAYSYDTIRKFSTTASYSVRFRNPGYHLGYGNTNPLARSSAWHVALSKTGYLNEAGRCLVMVTQIDNRPLALVLLNSFGSRSPLGDAGRIKRWLTTGAPGNVARPAREYALQKAAAFQ